jgi:hypothetical protein
MSALEWTNAALDEARVEALENGVQAVIERLEYGFREGDDRQWMADDALRMLQRLLETGSVKMAPAVIANAAPSTRIDGSGQPVTIVPDEAMPACPTCRENHPGSWAPCSKTLTVALAAQRQRDAWPLHVQPVPGLSPADAAQVEAETARSHAYAALAARHAYWCLSITYRGKDAAPCNCGSAR